jgi:hypothetical protein
LYGRRGGKHTKAPPQPRPRRFRDTKMEVRWSVFLATYAAAAAQMHTEAQPPPPPHTITKKQNNKNSVTFTVCV